MLRVILETELSLGEPNVDQGLVTWFDVRIMAGHGDENVEIGQARVARIHVGAVLDVGESLRDVLDADSAELAALYPVFFSADGFREEFVQGAGSNLLYFSDVQLAAGWDGRNVEHALVRRVCDTLGQGCEVAVVSCASETSACPNSSRAQSLS